MDSLPPAHALISPLPFIKTHARVAFLDDDAQLLDALATSLTGLNAQFFTQQRDLDDALARTRAARQADKALWNSFAESDTPNRMGKVFAYLTSPGRSAIFHIIVVDHMMPGERGRDFCARHRDEGVFRILLTGAADDHLAVEAFNAGDIDYFVPKQTPGLRSKLSNVLDETQTRLHAEIVRRIRSIADPEAIAALDTPSVQRSLKSVLKDFHVSEYVLLPQPLGIAAITTGSKLLWLQIETRRSQRELLGLLTEMNAAPELIERVRTGTHTVNMEVVAQSGGRAFLCAANLHLLGDDAALAVGVFEFP